MWVMSNLKSSRGLLNMAVNSTKDISTNTIEGSWSRVKRSIDGTCHVVATMYLQSYVNEFVFRYNYLEVANCPLLLEQVGKLGRLGV